MVSEVQNQNHFVLFPGSFHALQTMMNGSHFKNIHRLCLLGIFAVSQLISLQKKQGLLSCLACALGTKLRSSVRWAHSEPLSCVSPSHPLQLLKLQPFLETLASVLQHPGWGASPQNPYLPAPHPKSPPGTRFPPLVPDDRTQGCFIHSRCPSPQPVFLFCHERLRGNLWSKTPEVSSRSLLGCSYPSYPPVQFGSVESKDKILCVTFLCLKKK